MTDDLDPKLREFEAKLRQLRPFVEDSRRQTADGSRFSRYTGIVPRCIAATAATVLALIWLIPQPQPTEQVLHITSQPIPEIADLLPSAVCRPPSPNMRQQLAELLDEMNVAELPTVAKQEYPVVKIVVQTNPPQVVTPMVMPMGEHMRWRVDEDMLIF